MGIPTWLRGVMKERGYTGVRRTAKVLGVNYASFDRWLNGVTTPSIPSCRKLSAATGTPLREIVLMAALGDEDTRDTQAA